MPISSERWRPVDFYYQPLKNYQTTSMLSDWLVFIKYKDNMPIKTHREAKLKVLYFIFTRLWQSEKEVYDFSSVGMYVSSVPSQRLNH